MKNPFKIEELLGHDKNCPQVNNPCFCGYSSYLVRCGKGLSPETNKKNDVPVWKRFILGILFSLLFKLCRDYKTTYPDEKGKQIYP